MRTTPSPRPTLVALAVLAFVGAGGCSSSKTVSTASTVAVTSPEQNHADSATVTAGLGNMITTATSVVTFTTAGTKVPDAGAQLEVNWQQVEGTVKANDSSTYIAIEDAITALDTAGRAGDASAATKASANLATAVSTYLTNYP